jgi:long-chain acyl-CoA synthetase
MGNYKNLVEAVYGSVERYGSKTAVMWRENGKYETLRYDALFRRIADFAMGLQALGAKRDAKIAILSNSNYQWLIADLAILSLGAVTTPIYHTSTPQQVEFILYNAEVQIAIVENQKMLEKITESWPEHLQYVIVMKGSAAYNDRIKPWSEVEQIGQAIPKTEWMAQWKAIERDDLATIVHTSGTTGNPKGVMLTHGNLLANIEATSWSVPISALDTTLSFLPLSHILERMAGQFTPLLAGATIAYADSIDTVAEQLLEVRPTAIVSVPRLFEKIYSSVLQQVEQGSWIKKKIFYWAVNVAKEKYAHDTQGYGWKMPRDLEKRYRLADRLVFRKIRDKTGGRIRAMISGGAPLNPEIAEFFYGIGLPVLEGYGLTETSPVIAVNPAIKVKAGTVGRILPNLEVRIAADGEILVKGPSVMKGYYNQPEETAKVLSDGWFATGDIGTVDEEGYLKIVDRKKNIIVLATGKNVAPQPVEGAIALSRYVSQCVLIGDKRKYVTALIVPDFAVVKEWALSRGMGDLTPEQLVQSPELHALIGQEVEEATKDFAPFERPKKFALLPREFSIESGEITPTLKVKLKTVEQNYAPIIEALYAESEPVPVAQATGMVPLAVREAAAGQPELLQISGGGTAAMTMNAPVALGPVSRKDSWQTDHAGKSPIRSVIPILTGVAIGVGLGLLVRLVLM